MNLFLNHEGFENYLVFRKEDSNTHEQRGVKYLLNICSIFLTDMAHQ